MSMETLYVNACVVKLEQLTGRIATCLGKLTTDQIWARGHENENAVGNLVLHLMGNVRQRAMAALAGQPDVRERDKEFSNDHELTGDELTNRMRQTMTEALKVIADLTPEQLLRSYEVQGITSTGVEMLLNVVEHFGQHTGQIIYATKHLTGEDLGLWMPRKK